MTVSSDAAFEEAVTDFIWKYHGVSLGKLAETLGVGSTIAKQDAANIVQRLIDDGPKEISIADLESRGVHVKTVRAQLQRIGNKPFEPMTFPAFDPNELAKEAWERSTFRDSVKRLLVVVTRGRDGESQREFKVDFGFFWSPSAEDERLIAAEWEDVRRLVASGRGNDLPKESDTDRIHVKPKGKAGSDLVDAPGAIKMRRSGFAFNTAFLQELIASS